MRWLALVANVVWILAFSYMWLGENNDSVEDYLWLLVLVPAILSVVALLRLPRTEGWLSLYFKRKAAEERAKIRDIEEHG